MYLYRIVILGGVLFGLGFNIVFYFFWVDFWCIKWNKCFDVSQFDCLMLKGFIFMCVVILFDSFIVVYVDFYNFYVDVGVEFGDFIV